LQLHIFGMQLQGWVSATLGSIFASEIGFLV
jgi:hypothetical protein